MADAPAEISQLLEKAGAGDQPAQERLLQLAYVELRRLAFRYMRRERIDHTLQPTALVHEAYVRLFRGGEMQWRDHAHFIRSSARAMRQILVDHARKRHRVKRGGEAQKVELVESAVQACDEQPELLLALDECLERLQGMDPRQAQIVELLYFTGLTQQEAAQTLGVSEITVRREWRVARAWLWGELRRGTPA